MLASWRFVTYVTARARRISHQGRVAVAGVGWPTAAADERSYGED
jgi:hypothetical protein